MKYIHQSLFVGNHNQQLFKILINIYYLLTCAFLNYFSKLMVYLLLIFKFLIHGYYVVIPPILQISKSANVFTVFAFILLNICHVKFLQIFHLLHFNSIEYLEFHS